MSTIINADTSNGLKLTSDTSGEIELQSAGVTKAKITSSGLQNASGNPITSQAGRNLVINGNMAIDQRNVGASVTITSTGATQYTVDRFYGVSSVASKFTVQQNAAAVTPPIGFTNYLGATSSSAYSMGSGDYFAVGQQIEGFKYC